MEEQHENPEDHRGNPEEQRGNPEDQRGNPEDQRGNPEDQRGNPEEQRGNPEDQHNKVLHGSTANTSPAPGFSAKADDYTMFSHDLDDSATDPPEEEAMTVRMRRKVKEGCRQCFSLKMLRRRLPILQWLPGYRCPEFQSDLIAGLTVGLTVIPQGLAYAVVAGLPPQYGLYSGFMGCFVYMFLGTSKDITVGPTAIMSLITGAYAKSPVENDPTLALLLTLFCGFVQLLMGCLHLGILVNYLSHSVITAFTSAAAITIAFGQVKSVLGLQDVSDEFLQMVYDTFSKIPQTKVWDMVMGLVCMVILFLLKKLRDIQWEDSHDPDRVVPRHVGAARKTLWLVGTASNAIVVVAAGGVAASLMSYDINVISITDDITPGIPSFEPPAFSSARANLSTSQVFETIGTGFIIVPVLGLVEAIAIGKAFARVNNYKVDPTQELIAIGMANIVSSFVGSYPVTGSFSRTAVNSQSGVRTPAGGLFTGVLILLALQFLMPYCHYIPKSALAAVIIMAVIPMFDYKIFLSLWQISKWDLFVHVVTFLLSFIIGIEYGILVGAGVSLLLLLYPMSRPKVNVTHKPDMVVVRPDQGLFFPAVEYVGEKVAELCLDEDKSKHVIVDMRNVYGVDFTTVQGIKAMLAESARRNVRLVFCHVRPAVVRYIQRADLASFKVFGSIPEALEDLSTNDGKTVEEAKNA